MFKPLEYLFWLLLVSNSVLSSVAPKSELENRDIGLSRRQANKVDDSKFTLNCPVTETATVVKSAIKYSYYMGTYQMSSNVYSSNPFTLNGCSSGYFYMTFNVNYTAVKPSFFSVVLANGTKGITSDPTIDYRFYPNSLGYILYKTGGRSNYSPTTSSASSAAGSSGTVKYFILHDQTGSKLGANGLIITYLNSPSTLNKIIFDKGTKAFLVDDTRGPANINNIQVKCLANDTCLTASQAPSSSPSSGGGDSAPSNKPLPTNQVITNSLTVKSLKANKNYSENEKINIPCSGDFTLSLTSNSRDSDLFFGFSDANGITKDAKFVELQIGLKNGQNAIKDLVTAKVKRRNLVKRQGSAKINLVY
ncbi:hypothetical protein BB560_006130, partial [Smittium megazygosporum]